MPNDKIKEKYWYKIEEFVSKAIILKQALADKDFGMKYVSYIDIIKAKFIGI